MTRDTGPRPTWEDYWAGVGGEDYHAARRLAEISPRVRNAAEIHLWADTFGHPHLDWEAFAEAVDTDGTMSSTEHRLAQIVAALTAHDRTVSLTEVLGQMGSWEGQVWTILTEWATGGRYTTRENR